MRFTTQLRYEHELLIGMAEALRSGARGAAPADLPRFLVLLGQFTQLLQVHLLREDSVLYPALEASKDPATVALAAELRAEHGSLDRLVASFDALWTPDEIRRRWRDFCADLSDLLDYVAERTERENHELYPMIEGPEDIAA
jgi:iron-sulfur cluster repair protein YtfE (RIC family)